MLPSRDQLLGRIVPICSVLLSTMALQTVATQNFEGSGHVLKKGRLRSLMPTTIESDDTTYCTKVLPDDWLDLGIGKIEVEIRTH